VENPPPTRAGDGEDDTGRQTGIHFASEEQPARSNGSAPANTEGATDSPVASYVNNNPTRQEWPDCWSQDQIMYFCSQNEWLISKDKRLGCKVCSKVNSLATQTQQGLRLSHEWSGCLISAFGADKAKQLLSLRKKIKEHRDSKSHIKAAEIEKISSRNEIQKHIQDMHRTEYDTTCRVFRTAYKIGKHGRPFTDMPVDVRLQELNGVNMGRVLHSNNTCADIIDHVSTEMKKKVADDIVKNRRKLCVLIDESTTISGKSVLVVCLRSAIANAEPDTTFFDLLELDGTTANDITEKLLACLHKNGFDDHFLDECFVAFGCDGASVMLGRRVGVATQLCTRFPHLYVWHCSNHRLELAVGDVVKEVSGLNHFKIFFDKLYTLYHASPKNKRELCDCAQTIDQHLLSIGRKILSVRWVASSERTVKAVWESYKALQAHFSSAASDGLNDVFTSVSFVFNLGVMYDALTELSDLSRLLQKRDLTLPEADKLLARQVRVFESMISLPGPYTKSVLQARTEESFKNVALHENLRIVKINAGQFFRSMAENIKYIKALQPDTWPEGELDIQHGEEEVLRLCDRLKELRGSKTPEALKPLLKAVHTIAVSTSECERAFSCMNNILTDKRNSLAVTRLSNLIFLKSNGPPLEQFSPQSYVMSWLAKGRRSADERECEAPGRSSKDDPKTCWSLL
uniref:HAT C-terminal dimerisation domain-containing protein n=1 Tax=Sparus aurata TaxID=8175 RepID=A0A671U0D7_SPAAU